MTMPKRPRILAAMAKKRKRKNPHAVALGKRGGSKGGKLSAAMLTPEERRERARRAALARWRPTNPKRGG